MYAFNITNKKINKEKMSSFKCEFSKQEQANIDAEFGRFGDKVYLDHAGTTLYAASQIAAAARTLQENVYCNPHTCRDTGQLVDQVRYKILKFFNTNSFHYDVLFTANATAALKLVADCFRFKSFDGSANGSFYYCQDNHTSVLGMRNTVRAAHMYVLTKEQILQNLETAKCKNNVKNIESRANSLVVYAAQCNFSGYKMPHELIAQIQEHGLIQQGKCVSKNAASINDESSYFICLDAASYVGTSYLDLNKYKPDFVTISFYKIFGYPTGVGALLVSRRGAPLLDKRYYGGGTINFAYTDSHDQKYRTKIHERFEDGTLPFLSIAELQEGFNTIERLVPATEHLRSIERISLHVYNLAKYCHSELSKLQHANGAPVVKLYNYCGYENRKLQGGIVTFNILNDSGFYVGFAEVACMAALYKIMLRTGCFCNLGACKAYLGLSSATIAEQFEAGHICGDYNDLINGQPTGAVRLSFGYMTTFENVDCALKMISKCYKTVKISERLKFLNYAAKHLPQQLEHIPKQMLPKVKLICIYPVKSCAAYKINDSWELSANGGFKYDRQWMIVDGNGTPITQKNHTRLCMIQPRILNDERMLELRFENMQPICVPLELNVNGKKNTMCQTKVCKEQIEGQDCGDAVADWLADCLETNGVRLIKLLDTSGNGTGSSFANQAQFLLINIASVRFMCKRMNEHNENLESTIDRFRANIIIETIEPFEENDFKELFINNIKFKVDGLCSRCQMICINQETGEKTPEILRVLGHELEGKIKFGIYISLAKDELLNEKPKTVKCSTHCAVLRETKDFNEAWIKAIR